MNRRHSAADRAGSAVRYEGSKILDIPIGLHATGTRRETDSTTGTSTGP
ncbi:hypothetical protein ACFV2N_03295 [Streptomyces sp. NPDC059680]